jgi:hypothetical protein
MKLTVDIPNELSLEDPSSICECKVDSQWSESYKFRVKSFGELISGKSKYAANNAKEFILFLDSLNKDPEEIPDEHTNSTPSDNLKKYFQENKNGGKTCDDEQESKVIQEEKKSVIESESNLPLLI